MEIVAWILIAIIFVFMLTCLITSLYILYCLIDFFYECATAATKGFEDGKLGR